MMRDFFRRKPTQPAPTIDPADRLIAAFSGFTEKEWAALPELARRDHREHITWRL
jgi:hypothetical protein